MKIIKYIKLSEININDPFFDSLRNSYQGFNDWFIRKANLKAHVVYENNKIIAFLLLQNKNNGKIKVSTFKVVQSNRRIGERFIGIALKTAVIENAKEVYLTLFENNDTKTLVNLLNNWGFIKTGVKEKTGESIYTRKLDYQYGKSPKENYPFSLSNQNAKFYWLPIEGRFHAKLIGFDAGSDRLDKTYEDRASVFTVEKFYITNAPEAKIREIKSGDIIVLYRMGPNETVKGFSSIVTGYCVFEKYESLQGLSLDKFLAKVKNRTAYSETELCEIHKRNKSNFFALVSFLFVNRIKKNDTQYWILNDLRNMGIIEPKKGPRPFDLISKDDFKKLINQ